MAWTEHIRTLPESCIIEISRIKKNILIIPHENMWQIIKTDVRGDLSKSYHIVEWQIIKTDVRGDLSKSYHIVELTIGRMKIKKIFTLEIPCNQVALTEIQRRMQTDTKLVIE